MKEEEEPEVISIDDETLAPEENIDGYLEELSQKYHELSKQGSPVKANEAQDIKTPLGDQLEQMRSL